MNGISSGKQCLCADLRAASCLVILSALLLTTSGCNAFGNRKVVQELQAENERLISEFRAQRDSNERLKRQNHELETRVAESEKLLARTYQNGGPRISSLLGVDPAPRAATSFPPASSGSDSGFQSNGSTTPGGLKWEPR